MPPRSRIPYVAGSTSIVDWQGDVLSEQIAIIQDLMHVDSIQKIIAIVVLRRRICKGGDVDGSCYILTDGAVLSICCPARHLHTCMQDFRNHSLPESSLTATTTGFSVQGPVFVVLGGFRTAGS